MNINNTYQLSPCQPEINFIKRKLIHILSFIQTDSFYKFFRYNFSCNYYILEQSKVLILEITTSFKLQSFFYTFCNKKSMVMSVSNKQPENK